MLVIPCSPNRKCRVSTMSVNRSLRRRRMSRHTRLPHRGTFRTSRRSTAMRLDLRRNLHCSGGTVFRLTGSRGCSSPIHSSTQYKAEEDDAADFYRSKHWRSLLFTLLQFKCHVPTIGLQLPHFNLKSKPLTVPLLDQSHLSGNRFITFHVSKMPEYPIRLAHQYLPV